MSALSEQFKALKAAALGENEFTKFCTAVQHIDGIVHGFIHQEEHLDQKRGSKLPSGIGHNMGIVRKTRFRVVLWSEKGFAEEIMPDCREAVGACLRKLGITKPEGL